MSLTGFIRLQRLLFTLALVVSSDALLAACNVSTTGLSFGSYDVFSGTHNDSEGEVSVTCDTQTSYTLTLSGGNGTVSERYMLNGTHTLRYNLYTNSNRTLIWGDGTTGNSLGGSTSGTNIHTVYGRIPARQNVHVGDYQDSLILTLEY